MKSLGEAPLGRPLKIVLINDASSDQTGAIAKNYEKSLALEIIEHEKNWGLGASLRQGFERILPELQEGDYLVTMDADATHDPKIIAAMIEALRRLPADVVIASRFCGPGSGESGMPAVRRAVAHWARRLFAWRFPQIKRIADSTSGFRCYRAGLLKNLPDGEGRLELKQQHFAIQLELLLRCVALGAKIIEIPYFLRYQIKRSRSGFGYWRSLRDYVPILLSGV